MPSRSLRRARHQGCPGRRRGIHPARRNERTPLPPRRRHPRHGAARKQEVRRKATARRARGESRRRASGPGEGESEDAFRFVLSRDEFVDLFLDDLELPDLAKRKLAEAESEGLRRAGYTTSGSPANLSVSRTVRLALARRRRATAAATGDDRPTRGRTRRVATKATPRRVLCRDRDTEGKDPADPVHRPDRHPLSPLRRPCRSRCPGRHVLSDGRIRLDVRTHEGPREALLHAALRVPDSALSPRGDRLHSSYRPGGGSRRENVLPWAGVGRHSGVECAGGHASKSSGRGFAPRTGISTPPRLPTATTRTSDSAPCAGC